MSGDHNRMFPIPLTLTRVYPVMENLEKSWNSIIFFQAWKSHGNRLQVFENSLKVMEIKRHPFRKQSCLFLSSSISIQGIRSNFGVFHIFLYCDWNLASGSQRQNRRELMASVEARGLGTCLFHATKHVKGP